jgi:thiopurine S-methyltransferase
MHTDFWHERWDRGETGWHLDGVNPFLERHWPTLGIPAEARVFVPLCGSSEDLFWLAGQGHPVIGVELSAVAVQRFFADHAWTPEMTETRTARSFRAGHIEILCGDYFSIDQASLGPIDAVYDRGALVALPAEMRERYIDHLRSLVPAPATTLLIAFDYAQDQMPGPPFAVREDDLSRFFGETHTIEALSSQDALIDNPHFRDRGVTAMIETAFALTPKSAQWL